MLIIGAIILIVIAGVMVSMMAISDFGENVSEEGQEVADFYEDTYNKKDI